VPVDLSRVEEPRSATFTGYQDGARARSLVRTCAPSVVLAVVFPLDTSVPGCLLHGGVSTELG
jgi:hypothetical protein